MTVADFIGEATLRFREPDRVWLSALIGHLNQAVVETLAAMRQAGSEKALVDSTIDLEEGRLVYMLPSAAQDIVRAERMDTSGGDGTALPLIRIPFQQDDLELDGTFRRGWRDALGVYASNTYVLMPGRRLRLSGAPPTNYPAGVRLTYYPRLSRMRDLTDEPLGVPEEIHECVLAKALNRTRQSSGLTLSDPKAFQSWLGQMQMMEGQFLYPQDGETSPQWVETGMYS